MTSTSPRASLLATALVSLAFAPGCMFVELNGGYYFGSGSPGDELPAGTPETEVAAGPGYGIKFGFPIDIPNDDPLVRVGVGVGYEGFDAASVLDIPEVDVAVTVMKLGEMKLRA